MYNNIHGPIVNIWKQLLNIVNSLRNIFYLMNIGIPVMHVPTRPLEESPSSHQIESFRRQLCLSNDSASQTILAYLTPKNPSCNTNSVLEQDAKQDLPPFNEIPRMVIILQYSHYFINIYDLSICRNIISLMF